MVAIGKMQYNTVPFINISANTLAMLSVIGHVRQGLRRYILVIRGDLAPMKVYFKGAFPPPKSITLTTTPCLITFRRRPSPSAPGPPRKGAPGRRAVSLPKARATVFAPAGTPGAGHLLCCVCPGPSAPRRRNQTGTRLGASLLPCTHNDLWTGPDRNMILRLSLLLLLAAGGSLAVILPRGAVVARGRRRRRRRRRLLLDAIEAMEHGDAPEVRTLIAKGFDPNVEDERDGRRALHWAAERGRLAMVQVLLAAGADVNAKNHEGKTALHYAGKGGHVDVTKALLARGGWLHADVHARDEDGHTALWFATRCCDGAGHVAVIKALLAAGADPHVQYEWGRTLLHEASDHDRIVAIEPIIAAGADVNAKAWVGISPLHVAAIKGRNAEMIEVLIAQGANVNATCYFGKTALHVAGKNCHAAAIDALIAGGVDVNAEDMWGWTALTHANYHGCVDASGALRIGGGRAASPTHLEVATTAYNHVAAKLFGDSKTEDTGMLDASNI